MFCGVSGAELFQMAEVSHGSCLPSPTMECWVKQLNIKHTNNVKLLNLRDCELSKTQST